jgi:hypothetical protein
VARPCVRSSQSRWRRAGLRACLAALAVAPLAARSTLAGATPSARLVYSRTPEAASCPEESELRNAVAARFGYDPFFPSARQAVIVQISRQRARYVARVQLLDEQGITHGARELSSDHRDCSEIFDAVALAIAIALDAASKATPLSEPASESQPPPAPPPSVIAQPTVSPAATPPTTTPMASSEARESSQPAPMPRILIDAGIDALGSVGIVPSATPGMSVFARGRVKPWSLSIEVRADLPESAARSAALGGGRVQAWLASAGLAPCFHAGYIDACAVGMLGSLQASGLDIDPRFSKGAVFLAAGIRLGFEWPRSARYALRLHVDGMANLHRARLLLGQSLSGDEVWAAPAFAGTLGLGVVARFP